MVICMCVRACTSLGHIKITKAERFIKSYLLVKKKKKAYFFPFNVSCARMACPRVLSTLKALLEKRLKRTIHH